MRSNVCYIDKGTEDLAAILRECEKVAVYNELDHKQALHLRLLCEELDGMLPRMIGDFEGQLWIEFEQGVCRVNVSLEMKKLSAEHKAQLIDLAKNKKNAAAVGIVGRIRAALENMFLNEEVMDSLAASSGAFNFATGYSVGSDYSYYWSLQNYKKSVAPEQAEDAWDELEKSVIASVADDVIVGVKGHRADITVVKAFA